MSLARGVLVCVVLLAGCGDDDATAPQWQLVQEGLPGALLSVWGTSATDVWAVGADARDGTGPLVVHFDGTAWTRVPTGQTAGGLWWVFGFAGGPIYMGGEGGVILRYSGGAFSRMSTPGPNTVFGIWGASPDDLWAVGGASDATGGFAWRLRGGGDTWTDEPTMPADVPPMAAVWKAFGTTANDAWLVGSNGVSLHWDGSALTRGVTGVGSSLFTVHANSHRFTAVGGLSNGLIVEYQDGAWHNVDFDATAPSLSGVCLGADDTGFAVGALGAVYERSTSGWRAVDLGFDLTRNLHGVWIDPSGGVWAVGGRTFSAPQTDGVLIHRGEQIPLGGL